MTLTPPRSTTPPPLKKKDGGGVAALPFSLGFLNPAGEVAAGFGGVAEKPISASVINPSIVPAELIEAATRCCVEIHGDGADAVAAMLAELAEYPASAWPAQVTHFMAQLPTEPPATVITCAGCVHSVATSHPAILACAAGAESGLPIGGHWHTDRHYCPEFIDRLTGRKPAPINTTHDATPPTTRDSVYNPFE